MARRSKKDEDTKLRRRRSRRRKDDAEVDNVSNENKKESVKEKPGALDKVNDLLNTISVSVYGSGINNDIDDLQSRFDDVMKNEIDDITNNGKNDFNSFLGKLYDDDRKNERNVADIISDDKLRISGSEVGLNPQDLMTSEYRTRMLEQNDANQISNKLIELREAKEVMRDTILSADVTTGKIMRQIVFDHSSGVDYEKDYMPVVEAMEKKFDTQKKIKDFIVNNTLSYGTYYTYTIPYHEVFNDFARRYRKNGKKGETIYESVDSTYQDIRFVPLYEHKKDDTFLEDTAEDIFDQLYEEVTIEDKNLAIGKIKSDLDVLSNRITVCTTPVPIPILEEGLDGMGVFAEEYISEDGNFYEEDKGKDTELGTMIKDGDAAMFKRKYGGADEGMYEKKKNDIFEDLKDCYIKMIPPTRMMPIEMMHETLFYLYIQTDDTVPLSEILSYTTQLKMKDPSNRINMLLNDLADRIVERFDNKFVKENAKFKNIIVAALEYYDLSSTNIHFQLIPKEYVVEYKVNRDVDEHGHSMMEPSLFYGKLWLNLRMFQVHTILTKSNDEKINYVRTSGIDKNVYSKTQSLIRQKRARQITLNDMLSYSSVINKVGAGSEMYMPLGKSGEKPIETEILQGQEVQMNTDLMESLRTGYILGTSVPSAIMNYLNEADFAKSVETANTKMTGRAIDYQIDFNDPITQWYRQLLRYSTNMPEEVIQTVRFVLPQPKGSANIATQEILNNYTTLQEFLVKMYFGDNSENQSHQQKFIEQIAKLHLPMINFAEIDKIFKDTQLDDVNDSVGNKDVDTSFEL